MSWFRKVGDQSYHYPDIHACAYSDGESGEEQSPSGRDVGQREVTFVHCLGGLQEKEMQKGKKKVRNTLKGPREREGERERERLTHFSKRGVITEAVRRVSAVL